MFTLTAMAENTILVVGDSLSAGYGILKEQSWPSLLQKRLNENAYNYRVVNDSISGDTTSNGLARLPTALKKYSPRVTIIELGANDGLRGLSPSTIKLNLQHMVSLTLKSGSKVLVLGLRLPPNFGPQYTQAFQQIYTDLAKRSDIRVVPVFLNKIESDINYFQADRLHPTAAAQPIILDTVWPVLMEMIKTD